MTLFRQKNISLYSKSRYNIKQIRNIKPYERIKPARRKTFGRVDFAFKYKDSFLLVSPLHDGKMGSLTLFPHNTLNKERHFGVQVSECQFKDIDGVPVIASLYLDKDNELFELDIWKVDFSKLEMIPSHFEDVEYSNQIPKK